MAAPARSTFKAAARLANRTASSSSRPCASPAAKAPLKASPAPVVSRTCTGSAATRKYFSPADTNTPAAPSVTITVGMDRRRQSACRVSSSCAARLSASTLVSVRRSSNWANSLSFGVRMSISGQGRSMTADAGAGLCTVVTASPRARRSARWIAAGFTSCCVSSTRASLNTSLFASTCAIPSAMFAPGPTTIRFWPVPSSRMAAVPVASLSQRCQRAWMFSDSASAAAPSPITS